MIPNDLKLFEDLYGSSKEVIEHQKKRYRNIYDVFTEKFGTADSPLFFSAPGRIEIIGNHTDHNGGKIMAGSITLDIIAAAVPSEDNLISIYDIPYNSFFTVDMNLKELQETEKGKPEALIRGVAEGFSKNGFSAGGFKACIYSEVFQGSGLSSSASFEILLGCIINEFYNSGSVPLMELARIGQYAENDYMKKPSGLLDQSACALGGIVKLDFLDSKHPEIVKINKPLKNYGYSILVVDTGGSHAELTPHYASIPIEMKQAAGDFGREELRQIDFDDFIQKIPEVRKNSGDRAVLRAVHFYMENLRVEAAFDALVSDNIHSFLSFLRESGLSSLHYLQNAWVPGNEREQGLPFVLALSETYFSKKEIPAVSKLQGGGFAGTVLTFIPEEEVSGYKAFMEKILGKNKIRELGIRETSAGKIS